MPLDQDIARAAAEQANKLFGQWMPERWLNLFIDAYDDIAECREVDRIMTMPEEQLVSELAKDGETIESASAKGRAAFERALAHTRTTPADTEKKSDWFPYPIKESDA